MKHITKTQFYEMYVKDWLTDDKPANRQLWSNSLDVAYQDKKISQKQVNSWIYPNNKNF